MKAPLVTVLMPVYNGEAYLREAIQSILDQTYKNFIFLIINDGSTDKTEEIIMSFDDNRIQYIKNSENLRLVKTLNKGLSLIKTKYVARMDADDISLPERLERQVDFMEEYSDVGLSGTWCRTIGESEESVIHYETQHDLICFKQLFQIQIVHPSCMIRMEVLNKMDKLFDESFIHAEDYELFTRMSHYTKLGNIPYVLHLYRKHSNAVSVVFKDIQQTNTRIIKQRELAYFGVNATEQLVDDFTALNYQDYSHIVSSPNNIKDMLETMLKSNAVSQVYDRSIFSEALQRLWFSYCYELRLPLSVYKNSFLFRKISLSRFLKWKIKTFGKI